MAHEVDVVVRITSASRLRAAQLCGRLPQDLSRMAPVLGHAVRLYFALICDFASEHMRCDIHGFTCRRQGRRDRSKFEMKVAIAFMHF